MPHCLRPVPNRKRVFLRAFATTEKRQKRKFWAAPKSNPLIAQPTLLNVAGLARGHPCGDQIVNGALIVSHLLLLSSGTRCAHRASGRILSGCASACPLTQCGSAKSIPLFSFLTCASRSLFSVFRSWKQSSDFDWAAASGFAFSPRHRMLAAISLF